MILIIAYEYAHARGVASRMGLRSEQWRFVSEVDKLYGTRGATVLVVDTTRRRRGYHEIETILRETGAFAWYEEDYGRALHERELEYKRKATGS